jgi:hypothetical protein
MLSRREYIKRIKAHTETIIEDFGVRSLCLFGSVARNEQNESSDIDIFVDMEPDFLKIAGLKQYLESLLGHKVDIVRKHNKNDKLLIQQIEKDGIYVIVEKKKEKQDFKPYTMEEIRARMEIAERESAAGLGIDSEEMIRELEAEFAAEAATTSLSVPITASPSSAVNTFRYHNHIRSSQYHHYSFWPPPAVTVWPPSAAASRWPQVAQNAGIYPQGFSSPPRAWAVTPARCAAAWL